MKKILSILVIIMVIIGVSTIVNAKTSSELAEELYQIGKPYGFTTANKLKVERYLADNPVSDEVANKLIAKAKELKTEVFDKADTDSYSELSASQKEKLKSIANEAANLLGLTLKFKTKEVEIYKNGKLIEVARYDGDKFVYTGNSTNVVLVVSSVVIIALVSGFALRKKFANA